MTSVSLSTNTLLATSSVSFLYHPPTTDQNMMRMHKWAQAAARVVIVEVILEPKLTRRMALCSTETRQATVKTPLRLCLVWTIIIGWTIPDHHPCCRSLERRHRMTALMEVRACIAMIPRHHHFLVLCWHCWPNSKKGFLFWSKKTSPFDRRVPTKSPIPIAEIIMCSCAFEPCSQFRLITTWLGTPYLFCVWVNNFQCEESTYVL